MTRAESLLAEGEAKGKAKAEAELLLQINEQIAKNAEQIAEHKTRIENLEALVAQIIKQSKLDISF